VTRRRWIILAVAVFVVVLVAGVVLVHAPVVQTPVFQRVTATIEEDTGVAVEFDAAGLRLWPARLVAEQVTVAIGGVEVATIDRLEARWSWRGLMSAPRRIDILEVDGVHLDLTEVPELPDRPADEDGAATDPWRAVEIGHFEVRGDGGIGAFLDITTAMDGLAVQAALEDGTARFGVDASSLVLRRADRGLDLGAASIRASASDAGVLVERLSLAGGDVELTADGELDTGAGSGRTAFRAAAEVDRALGWWDPNLASGLGPSGRLELEGSASLGPGGELEAEVEHRGGRLSIGGYEIDDLGLRFEDDTVAVRIAGDPWGSADVSVERTGPATVAAELRGAPVERVLLVAAPELASRLGGPVSLSGRVSGTVSYPFDLGTLTGDVDVVASSALGRVELTADGARDHWRVSRARVEAAGAKIRARGELGPGDGSAFDVNLEVPDPAGFAARIAEWFPEVVLPRIGGGAISGELELSGDPVDPRLEGEVEWSSPVVEEIGLESARLWFAGGLDEVEFAASVRGDASVVQLEGVADPRAMRAEGGWEAELDNLQRTAALVPGQPAADLGLGGRLVSSGSFAAAPEGWSADGSAELADAGVGGWSVDHASVFFTAGPERLEIVKLDAEAYGGDFVGAAGLELGQGLGAPVTGSLEWTGVDTGRLPLGLEALVGGTSRGVVTVDGTLDSPVGEAELEWKPDEGSRVPAVNVGAVLAGGVLQVVTEELAAGSGALWIEGTAPLGSLPCPSGCGRTLQTERSC